VAFYRDTLGIRFLFEAPPRMAFFDLDGIRLMLGEPEGSDNKGASLLYYKVADIAQAHETLVERGVIFDVDPHFVARHGRSRVVVGLLPRQRREPNGSHVRGREVVEALRTASPRPLTSDP
jgi:hypothetical protein